MNVTIATMGTVCTVPDAPKGRPYDNAQGAPTLKLRLRQEPTLKDICYELIKDTFFHGVYGDTSSPETCFRLVIDKRTGFFNATKMCQAGGKRVDKWLRLESSKQLVSFLEKDRCPDLGIGPVFEVNSGNRDQSGALISGTYVCKELILSLASWISPAFYLRCSRIVNDFFIPKNASMDPEERQNMMKLLKEQEDKINQQGSMLQEKDDKINQQGSMLQEKDDKINQQGSMLQEKDDKIEQLIQEMRQRDKAMNKKVDLLHDKMDETLHENSDLKDRVTTVQKKLNIAVEDRAPQPDKTIKKERFVMMKRSDAEYPYYVVRGQTAYTASVIRAQKKDHETVEILVDFNHHPNSKTFYNRVKDQLRSQGAEALGNAIRIENSDLTEQNLIAILEDVNEEKRTIGEL